MQRIANDTENRLMLLFTLSRLGPVTSAQLLRFLVEGDVMNYFDMQLNLAELETQGTAAVRPHPLGELWQLTPEGLSSVALLAGRIPLSRREQVERLAPQWRQRFQAEQQAPADSFPLPGGGICAHLRLMQGDTACLDILLPLPETAQLPLLQQRWQQVAAQAYRQLMAGLTQGDEAADTLPPGTAIAPLGSEWLLSLQGEERPPLEVTLTFAAEADARRCAACWPCVGAEIRAMLAELLLNTNISMQDIG